MKTVKGDLIKLAMCGKFDIIVHGANCFHTFGAGIAKQIKKAFPEAYVADKETMFGDMSKLGTLSSHMYKRLLVINAYTQYEYGTDKMNVDYGAIRSCMMKINQIARCLELERIGIPKIGAGLAGGDWNIISRIIEDEIDSWRLTLVEFNLYGE